MLPSLRRLEGLKVSKERMKMLFFYEKYEERERVRGYNCKGIKCVCIRCMSQKSLIIYSLEIQGLMCYIFFVMRLSKNQIEHMAFQIVKFLIRNEKLSVLDRNKLVEKIEKVITDEFLLEDKLDDEVKEILSRYLEEIRKGNIEYHTVFRMIKQKIAKERKIVL